MKVQTINIGNQVNDGLGDDLRTAFQKVNANFATLDSEFTVTGLNLGSNGIGLFKQKVGAELQFKKLVSGIKILLEDDPDTDTVIVNSTAPDAFTRFETNAGNVLAGTHQVLTLSGTQAPNNVTGRADIEVTTSGSYVYFKNIIPVTDILTVYDFGTITGQFTNTMQVAMAAANIDFGTIALPGRLDIDCGGII